MNRDLLRQEALRIRDGLPEATRQADSVAITQHVQAHPAYQAARSVFVYVSVGSEVDTHMLMAQILADGKRLLLPRCAAKHQMDAVPVLDLTHLPKDRYGIPSPPAHLLSETPDAIDLVLVPGLLFDHEGHRIGYGGGYYDRYLARCPAYRIALAFDAQLSDTPLPHTPLDMPMHALMTPRGPLVIKRWEGILRGHL